MMIKAIQLSAIVVAFTAGGLVWADTGPTKLSQKADQEKKSEQEKKADEEKKAAGQKAADEANDKSVTISSQSNKSKVASTGTNIVFDVAPAAAAAAVPAASKADHVHVYVDGERVAQLRELKGSYAVDKLVPGKHWLCIRVVDRADTPVGLEKCVEVNAGNVPAMGY